MKNILKLVIVFCFFSACNVGHKNEIKEATDLLEKEIEPTEIGKMFPASFCRYELLLCNH